MNVKKIGCLVAVLAPFALFGMPSAQANGEAASATPAAVKAVVPTPAVIVKVGDAVLEEYRNGDPDKRTTILRGEETAQNAASAVSEKKHS